MRMFDIELPPTTVPTCAVWHASRKHTHKSCFFGICWHVFGKLGHFLAFLAGALIGLDLWTGEGEAGSSGGQSPDFGDMWRYCCPRSPDWDSDGESWSESEGLSSSDFREHNVESLALNVIGQNWSGLGTCEGGFVLPHCPGYAVPGNAWGLVAGLPLPKTPLSQQGRPFSHLGRAVTIKERGCGERNWSDKLKLWKMFGRKWVSQVQLGFFFEYRAWSLE